MENQTTLNGYIKQAIVSNWHREALSNLHGETYLFRDIARKVAKMHLMYEAAGVKQGDKIALCGRNSAEWCIAFVSVIAYGAVAVPILNDFTPDTIEHLVNHCEAKVLFTDLATWKRINPGKMPAVAGAVRIEDFSLLLSREKSITDARKHLNQMFGEKYPERFKPQDVFFADVSPDSVQLINYTAGSTGFSKGVMLSERALWSNLQFCIDGLTFLKPGDSMLSLLPMAHMYGLMVEMLHPLVKGCHVFLLNRTPSPKILLDAFRTVRPKLIVAVPLVIEKIITTRIFPKLKKPLMQLLLHVPGVDAKIYASIRRKLIDAFGGNLLQVIVGGAAMNKDVEEFLIKIRFPFTVGYGMTECGPLISYCPWDKQRPGSCGKIVDRMQIKVDSDDPAKYPGLLWVKGDNVMSGYFNNPQADAEVMRGKWMNTGDIAQVDNDGYIYIRGRDKNMILGPSGQNIYPEEIEQKLNAAPLVAESIVIDHDGRLQALVHPDYEEASKQGLDTEESLRKALEQTLSDVNKELPGYSRIHDLRIFKEEFEKTPKKSIKRYLYKQA